MGVKGTVKLVIFNKFFMKILTTYQEVQHNPSSMNTKISTSRHIIIKVLKDKRILKAVREVIHYIHSSMRLTADFSL